MELDEYKKVLKYLIKQQDELEHAKLECIELHTELSLAKTRCIELQDMVLSCIIKSGLVKDSEIKDLEEELHGTGRIQTDLKRPNRTAGRT